MSAYKNLVSSNSLNLSNSSIPANVSANVSANEAIPGQEHKMNANNNGGVSFSLKALASHAKAKGDMNLYRTCQLTLLRRVMIMGTEKNQFAVSAQKLTTDAIQLLTNLIRDGEWHLILQEIKEVYGKSLAPKLSFALLALAFLTTVPDEISGSAKNTASIRTQAYNCVSSFRTLSHLLQWEMFHLTLSKERKVKSTGEGFRRAVSGWLSAHPADWLAYQITKYQSREGVSVQDLIRFVHIKSTTAIKCKCKKKKANDTCSCDASKPVQDILPPAQQIVLSYIAHDLKHASITLSQCMLRSLSNSANSTNSTVDTKMADAIKVFAFLCAVDASKNASTTVPDLCEMIASFNLSREVIATNHLNSCEIWVHLLCKMDANGYGRLVQKLVKANTTDSAILAMLPQITQDKGECAGLLPANVQINMPITALVRNLAKLSSLDIFSSSTHPLGRELEMAICRRLVDPVVLEKGHVHPMSIMSAQATYKNGKGIKGSLTWRPNSSILKALEDAFYVSFRTLKGHGYKLAHGIDASGSMAGTTTPVSGMMASEVVACMVMAFYRVEYAYSGLKKTQFRQDIGYFGGSTRSFYSSNSSFTDITSDVSHGTTFAEMCKIIQRSNWGSTDIGCFIQWAINRLTASLTGCKAKQNGLHKLPVFAWPGYYDALLIWTDNDVNSGCQPMPLFRQYQTLVKTCFETQPMSEDGKVLETSSLQQMINNNVPKLIVIATVPTAYTVGDPEDTNVLNVSGFDLSVPTLIDNFLSGGSEGKVDGIDDDIEVDVVDIENDD